MVNRPVGFGEPDWETATVVAGRSKEAVDVSSKREAAEARWLELELLPKNANGKIDRNNLKESFREEPAAKS